MRKGDWVGSAVRGRVCIQAENRNIYPEVREGARQLFTLSVTWSGCPFIPPGFPLAQQGLPVTLGVSPAVTGWGAGAAVRQRGEGAWRPQLGRVALLSGGRGTAAPLSSKGRPNLLIKLSTGGLPRHLFCSQ